MKLRGLYAEGNFAATTLLRAWLSPLASLDADAVVANPTGSTDHVSFDRAGLPGRRIGPLPIDRDRVAGDARLGTG